MNIITLSLLKKSFQVLEPLRAMITGTPLEDARHLAQRYSRMRQEAETQVIRKLLICCISVN